jgi:hypothetical protein
MIGMQNYLRHLKGSKQPASLLETTYITTKHPNITIFADFSL